MLFDRIKMSPQENMKLITVTIAWLKIKEGVLILYKMSKRGNFRDIENTILIL